MGIAYNSSIVRDGLVLHLDAANQKSYPSSGTTWSDLSGNGNNGTLVNGVGYNSANGGGLTFDQTNDWIILNNTINVSGNYTISFCCFPTVEGSNRNQQWLFDQGGGGSGITLYGYNTGRLAIRDSSNGSRYTWNGSGNSVNVNYRDDLRSNYCFLDFVSDGTNVNCYLNTIDKGYVTPATVNFQINYISTNRTSDDQIFGGLIYFSKIYNRALTAAEVRQNFESMRGRYGI